MSCGDVFKFYFVHSLLQREMERCLKRHASYLGLSSIELQVLWIAGSSDTTTFADLARITSYTKNELGEIVAALERDDLVEQVCAGDSPCRFVRATDKGKQIVSQIANRPNRCRCPVDIDAERLRELTEECRDFLMQLKGRPAGELLAHMDPFEN